MLKYLELYAKVFEHKEYYQKPMKISFSLIWAPKEFELAQHFLLSPIQLKPPKTFRSILYRKIYFLFSSIKNNYLFWDNFPKLLNFLLCYCLFLGNLN